MKSELLHTIELENEEGTKVLICIDPSDMVQVSNITEVLAKFESIQNIEYAPSENVQDLLVTTRKISCLFKEIDTLLDDAFGVELRRDIFKSSHSLLVYNEFFEKLSNEIDYIGAKTKDYIAEVRKQGLVNDHKSSDTL